MPSPKKRQHTVVKNSHFQENSRLALKGEEQTRDERIAARRADLLYTRQVDLDTLMDKHDDLVREAFHLDKFVTLLGYNPKVAKEDNSQVFLEYKAPHDLISQTAESSSSTPGRVTRKTRRATTEFKVSLTATISVGTSTPTSTLATKQRQASQNELTPKNIFGKTKSSMKAEPITVKSPLSKGKERAADSYIATTASDALPPPLSISKRDLFPRRAKDLVASASPRTSACGTRPVPEAPHVVKRLVFGSSSFTAGQTDLLPTAADGSQGERTFPEPEPPPQLPKITIRRIRLFQRPPPIVYTHPSQIPSHPRHGGSIHRFLGSYMSLENGIDVSRKELDAVSFSEAKTRSRIRELRKEGRLMLDIPELPDGSNVLSNINEPEGDRMDLRDGDHYDSLISAAAHQGRLIANEYALKRSMAKRVAKLIMVWHGNKEGTEEKQRKAEAVRLKVLAKFAAKEVEKQWKKAVAAVRERNRELLEAEEARLGQKHLDAILDQSGVILEAQHTDLSRARSRSSSVKDWSDNEGSANVDNDGQVNDYDIESDSGPSGEGEDADVDVSLLLGIDGRSSMDRRGLSSEVESESATNDDDAVISGFFSPHETSVLASQGPLGVPFVSTEAESIHHSGAGDKIITLLDGHAIQINKEYVSVQDQGSNPHSSIVSSSSESPKSTLSALQDGDPILASSPSAVALKGYRDTVHSPSRLFTLSIHSSPPLSPSTFSPRDLASSSDLPLRPSTSSFLSNSRSPESVSPQTMQTPNSDSVAAEPNGHQPVAIRLSNGVIIYRAADPPPLFHEAFTAGSDRNSSQAHDGYGLDVQSDGAVEKPDIDMPEAASSVSIAPETTHESIKPDKSDLSRAIDTPVGVGLNDAASLRSSETQQLTSLSDPQAGPTATQTTSLLDESDEDDDINGQRVAPYLADFAAAPVEWDSNAKIGAPFLLRGNLRPYQQSGLEWLASLHTNNLNGILADEMGLGKTIQTISLLAHLACDRGIWGPHLIVVPTSVLLNWEMEFKKFLPGFKVLPYHGSTKRRKELRVGWNNKHAFNVCVTSYTLASRDAHIFKRKAWYYMILDEAHMIKNFKSQRWNILLMFRSFRRLLLTGTPLQNNLTELWALLQFLMSGTNFANVKEFGDWFSNPLEKAIEQGTIMDEETQERVRKLHTVLRPYLLRRLKADVEKELPSKFDHIVICRLSKRQRFLYDEFMSRAQTRDALASGIYHKVANILMQLRKVCNHPDLFEVRPIVTSFAMPRSATADFEVKDLLLRRQFPGEPAKNLNLDLLGLVFIQHQGKSMMQARSTRSLDASACLPFVSELPGEPPPADLRTIDGFKRHIAYQRQLALLRQWTQIAYTNNLRCAASPVYGSETISVVRRLYTPLVPMSATQSRSDYLDQSCVLPALVKSYIQREQDLDGFIDRFAFITPPVVARDLPLIALSGVDRQILHARQLDPELDTILHRTSVKLQIAFPHASLIQYDCGKLQELASLLRKRDAGGHRVLIFTQMTKVLDILEIFLNFHGYRYLRLDGATKIEDRQYITERFNNDARVFAFIASSRSGGVGINLTGADTVIFYDSDFNPQMDRQCEDRAHRIGQIRDVHIYRFISEHTVEESMLRKANQKRSLDHIVIQQGEFDWRSLLIDDEAFGRALGEFEDKEDAHAARVAAREEAAKEVEDFADFVAEAEDTIERAPSTHLPGETTLDEDEMEEDGTIADYMLAFVNRDWEWFSTWRT
ncbi:hypothetical protein K439DRAFT_1628697 [Ramaria rubella]|nr:hypothetical protein K439DRAFT_1628697 [Ramaria rubella]